MTPTMEAPVDSGASSPTADSVLDEVVGMMTDDGAGEAPPAEDAVPPVEGEAPPAEQAEGEQPQEGEQPPAAEGEYQLTEDGQNYLVPKNDLAGIKAIREYSSKVQEWFPTVQDADQARQYSAGMRMLYNDYNSGTDQGIETLLGYYAGRDVSPQFPELKAQWQQNFAKMADKVPQVLKSMIGPEAEYKFTDGIMRREIDAAYQVAAQSGNPADLKSAQWLDYGWTGQYKTELQKPQGPQPDAAITAREQSINQRETQLLERDWKVFNDGQLEGKKWSDFYAEVDRTINPVKEHYKPGAWPHIRQGVINEVLNKLKQDKLWADEHGATLNSLKQAYDSRWKAGRDASDLKQSIQAYQNDFMVRARRYLPSIAKTVLEDAPAQPKGAAPANGTAKPPAAQNGRAANGQFQKAPPAKPGQSKQEREAQLLDSISKDMNW